jgi:hypothetical protein
MTQKTIVEKKAEVQETSAPVVAQEPQKKGDYTKFFYRNIERLWDAVSELQQENSQLRQQLKNASVVLNGGA